jgi:hypothetical protein
LASHLLQIKKKRHGKADSYDGKFLILFKIVIPTYLGCGVEE